MGDSDGDREKVSRVGVWVLLFLAYGLDPFLVARLQRVNIDRYRIMASRADANTASLDE